MGEKAKNAIIDILKSEECKEYFEMLLQGQTDKIAHIIDERNNVNQADDLMVVKKSLKEECQKRQEAENETMKMSREKDLLQEKCNNLTETCNILDGRLSMADEKIEQLKQQIVGLEKKNAETEQKAHEEIQKNQKIISSFQEQLDRYEVRYSDIDKAFSVYLSLTDEVKYRLRNIFKAENLFAFIAAISDWNNIEGLWSFSKRRLIEDEFNDAEKLVFLFRFLFNAYSRLSDSCAYELISPAIGDRFDSDKHSVKGIKTDGRISEMLLDGIYDIVSKKTIYKAVVNVQ